LAVDEYSLVMALAGCLSDGEIPAPNLAAVRLSGTETGVPDVTEKDRGNQAIDGLLFPGPRVLTHLTACREIGDAGRKAVKCGRIGRGRDTPHTSPFRDVTSAQDLGALPAIAPPPAVVHATAQPATQLGVAQMLALGLSERHGEPIGI